jgi:hypothetical protein
MSSQITSCAASTQKEFFFRTGIVHHCFAARENNQLSGPARRQVVLPLIGVETGLPEGGVLESLAKQSNKDCSIGDPFRFDSASFL